jgi:hypothetical protein
MASTSLNKREKAFAALSLALFRVRVLVYPLIERSNFSVRNQATGHQRWR